MPRQKAPALTVPLLGGGVFDLAAAKPERGSLIVFYRGLHCPICATYLKELERLTPEFRARGVEPVAISSDAEDRARAMAEKVGAAVLPFGHSLDLGVARDWGLYISTSRGKTSIGIEEPALFSEPGVFLVDKDGRIYWLYIQSMPFSRPHFSELLSALDFAIAKSYPARGEYDGPVDAAA